MAVSEQLVNTGTKKREREREKERTDQIRDMRSKCLTDCVLVSVCVFYPARDGLKNSRQAVALKLEEFRWLTVHCESVGVIVKLNRAHKVAVTCHHIRQLEKGRKVFVIFQMHLIDVLKVQYVICQNRF